MSYDRAAYSSDCGETLSRAGPANNLDGLAGWLLMSRLSTAVYDRTEIANLQPVIASIVHGRAGDTEDEILLLMYANNWPPTIY